MNISTSYDGIVIFASEPECLSDAPDPYRSLMHYLHFLTIPLYTLSIYVLMFKSPISLRDYKKYLLWHTVGNLIFELYISIFMLPVTYLPLIVFRGAGLLKYFNISGILQFYLLVGTIVHTGLSVMEMYKYRFNATVSENTFNKKLLQKIVIFFWIIAIFIPVGGFCTTPLSIPNQFGYKQKLWRAHPDSSIQIVCHNSVTSPPLVSYLFTPLMVMIITTIMTAVIIVPHTTFTIWVKLDQLSKRLSRKTIALQKMLLISLFIQAAIHGIMLGAPIVTFVYSIYFSLESNGLAYILLILISFHGSISTIAMVGFTKPIRIGAIQVIGQAFPRIKCYYNKTATLEPTLEARSVFTSRNSVN